MHSYFRLIAVCALTVVFVLAYTLYAGTHASADKHFDTIARLADSIQGMKAPQIEKPSWVAEHEEKVRQEQLKTQQTIASVGGIPGSSRVFTYTVRTQGMTRSNLAEFRAEAAATLSDARGWSRAGVGFHELDSSGMFNLVLVEAAILDTVPGCSSSWSCRSGTNVFINDDRWVSATPAWNNAGGDLRSYHHMVINHEVGHWLGHDHQYCAGAGQPAPLMQQQSIDLRGCTFNPWPLDSELWVGR